MKIFIVDKKTQTGIFISAFPSDIKEHIHNPDYLIWLDFPEPNYEWIRRTFKIKKKVIEQCKNTNPIVFHEPQKNKLFLKTFFINAKKFPENIQSDQINFIFSDRVILTLHSIPANCFDNLNYISEDLTKIFLKGTDTFTVYLLNTIIDKNLKICSMFDNVIQTAEKKLTSNNCNGLRDSLFELKKHTLTYKTFTGEQLKVVRKMVKQPPTSIKKVSAKKLLNELHFKTASFYSELSRIDNLADLITQNYSDKKMSSTIIKHGNYLKKIIMVNFIIIYVLIALFFLAILRLTK